MAGEGLHTGSGSTIRPVLLLAGHIDTVAQADKVMVIQERLKPSAETLRQIFDNDADVLRKAVQKSSINLL